MNKKEQLLTDALSDPADEHYALAAAVYARHRRRTKQTLGAASAVLSLIVAGFVAYRPSSSPHQNPEAPSAAFETMSDQELVTQLKGQSVMIVKGPAGINDVVFLAQEKLR